MKHGNVDRRVWLCTCVLWGFVALPLGAADAPRVRVLTYNIHHGEGMDGPIPLVSTIDCRS